MTDIIPGPEHPHVPLNRGPQTLLAQHAQRPHFEVDGLRRRTLFQLLVLVAGNVLRADVAEEHLAEKRVEVLQIGALDLYAALREVRECVESLGDMLAKADAANGGPMQDKSFDLSRLSDEELHTVATLLEKAYVRSD